jgi:tetratricopeptide (TPR) repeat protein
MPPRSRAPSLLALALAGTLVLVPAPGRAHPDHEVLAAAVRAELARKPGDPELLRRQGRLREMAGDWEGALVELEHARDHGADPAAVAAARGRVFLRAGWPRMALVEYERVLAMRPDAFEILFERGRAWRALGRADEADRDFGRAIANMSAPRPEQVVERRDALLGSGRREEAVRALDEGIRRLGHIPSLELAAVDLEVELGRFTRALARLDALLARAPANTAWIAQRGDVLARAGRHREARAEFARALAQVQRGARPGRGRASQDLERRLRAALAPADIR